MSRPPALRATAPKLNGHWAELTQPCRRDTEHLEALLEYAANGYASHVEWFHRHRENGVRLLASVLTAEFVVAGVALSAESLATVAPIGLVVLALLSGLFGNLACVSCRQSHRAAMEHTALLAKTIWALGLAGPVPIRASERHSGSAPLNADGTIYVPRYLEDATDAGTTEEYVRNRFARKGTAYRATQSILRCMQVAGVVVGLMGAILVYMRWR